MVFTEHLLCINSQTKYFMYIILHNKCYIRVDLKKEVYCKIRKRKLRLIVCLDHMLSAVSGNFQWVVSFKVFDDPQR